MHPNIAASDIIYYVVRQPLFGTLEIDSFAVPEDGKEDYKAVVKVFEQSVINDHQLHYVQVCLTCLNSCYRDSCTVQLLQV